MDSGVFPVFKVNLGNNKSILLLSLGYGIRGDVFFLIILYYIFHDFCHRHLLFSQQEKTKYGFCLYLLCQLGHVLL